MRKIIALLAIFAPGGFCLAGNDISFPNFDSNKTCNDAFSPSGTYPSWQLLKICLRSEQRNYNMSRIAWEYLSVRSAQDCDRQLAESIQKAHKTRKFRYDGLVDPYTELWLCIGRKMREEEAQAQPKGVEKW